MNETIHIAVGRLGEVISTGTKVVEVGGQSILLCSSDDRIFAIANQCSHAQEELACGRIRNGWIACPAHGARFDLETGEPLFGPATVPIRTYPVRVKDGMIEIAV